MFQIHIPKGFIQSQQSAHRGLFDHSNKKKKTSQKTADIHLVFKNSTGSETVW